MFLESIYHFVAIFIIVALIHFYESISPLEKFKRIKNLKTDFILIIFSSCLVLIINNLLLSDIVLSTLNNFISFREKINFIPLWIKFALSLVVGDFGYYVFHRLMHKPYLWRAHQLHHSTKKIYWFSGLRTSLINSLIVRLPYLISFQMFNIPFEEFYIYGIILVTVNFWVHSNINTRFDKILSFAIITPRFHRIHHVNEKSLSGKNFGNIFSIWDFIFKTAEYNEKHDNLNKGEDLQWKKVPRQIIGI